LRSWLCLATFTTNICFANVALSRS